MSSPLDLSIPISTSSSAATGSDLIESENPFTFGDVIVGGTPKTSLIEKIARDVAVGLCVAVAARFILPKLGKILK